MTRVNDLPSASPTTPATALLPERVPFFSQAATFRDLWPLIRRHLDEIVDRGKYSHGPKVAEFETALAA